MVSNLALAGLAGYWTGRRYALRPVAHCLGGG